MSTTKKTATKKSPSTEQVSSNQPPVINLKSHENETLDIDHEIVEDEGQQVEKVKLELAKFGRADQAIAVLKSKYGELKVEGLEDKEGYKIARKAWSEVRGYRTGLEKKKKSIKEFYIKMGKAIDAEEERLVDLISPLEDHLYKIWKAIDEEKELEEKKKEEAELQQLQERVTELMAIGLRMNSGYYSLGDTITIDVATLRTMTAENYLVFLGKCKVKAEEIKAEEDRIKKEKEIEENRLKEEKRQLEEDRKKLEEEKKELAKMREEKAQMIREKRILAMAGIKMEHDPKHGTFTYYNGFNSVMADAQEVFSLDDEQFKEFVNQASLDVKQKINEWETHKIQVEKEKEEREKKHEKIFDIMTAAGLSFTSQDNYIFKNSEGSITIPLSDLMAMSEPDIKSLAKRKSDEIEVLKGREKLAEANKKKEEEKERLEGMSDAQIWSEKLEKMLRAIDIDPSSFASKIYKTKAKNLKSELIDVINKFVK